MDWVVHKSVCPSAGGEYNPIAHYKPRRLNRRSEVHLVIAGAAIETNQKSSTISTNPYITGEYIESERFTKALGHKRMPYGRETFGVQTPTFV